MTQDAKSPLPTTPLPWKVTKPGHGQKTKYRCVQIGKDENYSTLELEPGDARYIVQACNAYPAMRAVLEKARHVVEEADDSWKREYIESLLVEIDAALQAAEQGAIEPS